MTIAALSWPAASIYIALIVAVALVVACMIWSIFRTGKTAIKKEAGQREVIERLQTEVAELRDELDLVSASGSPR